MPIKATGPVKGWLCQSCAGWHCNTCDAPTILLQYYSADQCIQAGRIVKCPLNNYRFIPTISYPIITHVLSAFPGALGKYHHIT